MNKQEIKVGDKVDYRILDGEWKEKYATVIYFDKETGQPVCQMNYPAHDGCYWAHKYTWESIRKSQTK